MTIINRHERRFDAPATEVGALVDALSSHDDRLWPRDRWPAMRLDRPLAIGAAGGHGPIRYTVEAYDPGRMVRFRFTKPAGFNGTHGFTVATDPGGSVLRHELVMELSGSARLSWPLVFRPLHDALIEDSLDRAAVTLGESPRAAAWSPQVRALRAILGGGRRTGRGRASAAEADGGGRRRVEEGAEMRGRSDDD